MREASPARKRARDESPPVRGSRVTATHTKRPRSLPNAAKVVASSQSPPFWGVALERDVRVLEGLGTPLVVSVRPHGAGDITCSTLST